MKPAGPYDLRDSPDEGRRVMGDGRSTAIAAGRPSVKATFGIKARPSLVRITRGEDGSGRTDGRAGYIAEGM